MDLADREHGFLRMPGLSSGCPILFERSPARHIARLMPRMRRPQSLGWGNPKIHGRDRPAGFAQTLPNLLR
jgi:hypothetical protein